MGISTDAYVELINAWAKDRGLDLASAKLQLNKLIEEVGELASGINKDNIQVIKDSIGDAFVVLTIMCLQLNISFNECIALAYNEIKDRKGRMVNGIFVKEEDIPLEIAK